MSLMTLLTPTLTVSIPWARPASGANTAPQIAVATSAPNILRILHSSLSSADAEAAFLLSSFHRRLCGPRRSRHRPCKCCASIALEHTRQINILETPDVDALVFRHFSFHRLGRVDPHFGADALLA